MVCHRLTLPRSRSTGPARRMAAPPDITDGTSRTWVRAWLSRGHQVTMTESCTTCSVPAARPAFEAVSVSSMTVSEKACWILSTKMGPSDYPRVFPTPPLQRRLVAHRASPASTSSLPPTIVTLRSSLPLRPRIILSLTPVTRHWAAKPSPGAWTAISRRRIRTRLTSPYSEN